MWLQVARCFRFCRNPLAGYNWWCSRGAGDRLHRETISHGAAPPRSRIGYSIGPRLCTGCTGGCVSGGACMRGAGCSLAGPGILGNFASNKWLDLTMQEKWSRSVIRTRFGCALYLCICGNETIPTRAHSPACRHHWYKNLKWRESLQHKNTYCDALALC